jgi:uncharacterized protein with HEPN domain
MAAVGSLLYLAHMLDNIERIRGWTEGMTFEAYQADPMLRDATERCLERISEASRRLSGNVKARQPQVPWRKDELGALREAVKTLMQEA